MGKEKGPSERRIVHALLLSESSWKESSVASDDIENNKVSSHTNTRTQYFAPDLIKSIFARKKRATITNIPELIEDVSSSIGKFDYSDAQHPREHILCSRPQNIDNFWPTVTLI